ncbi:MAG: DUF3310 domain-containing protein [Tannerella sp.]|jgi:hypothetical protein|nr:DUF3310 domain-containing protein [Tannerella sp.]
MEDNINRPEHYTSHPSGIECTQITECHNFCIANAIKHLWRAGPEADADKSSQDKTIEDLEKKPCGVSGMKWTNQEIII